MGWLRLVGSLKSHVSFAEYRLFYRALLRKRPVILKSLLIVATPYVTRLTRTKMFWRTCSPSHYMTRLTRTIVIERNPPLWGGFLFTMFPHQEPCVRGPPSKDLYQVIEGGPLTHGSWCGNVVNRKPPQGGGFLSINMSHKSREPNFCGEHVLHLIVCHTTHENQRLRSLNESLCLSFKCGI